MKKKLLAVFLFSATTMLCAQTLQTSNKYFEVGNFKEVHNPAWGVTDDPFFGHVLYRSHAIFSFFYRNHADTPFLSFWQSICGLP